MRLIHRDREAQIARAAYREAAATQQAYAREQGRGASEDAMYLGLNENTTRTLRAYKAAKRAAKGC